MYSLLIYFCMTISGATELPTVQRNAFYGPGSGSIYLERVNCRGSEKMLLSCERGSFLGLHSCTHSQDAGVRCPGQYMKMKPFICLPCVYCICICVVWAHEESILEVFSTLIIIDIQSTLINYSVVNVDSVTTRLPMSSYCCRS